MCRKWFGLAAAICAVFMLFNFACKSHVPDTTVCVRIANRSDSQMQKVVVKFGAQEENYGDIPPKGVTDYRQVKESFEAGRISALVDGRPAVIETQDVIGEKRLEPGKYTYVLTPSQGVVTSKFERLHFQLEKN